MMTHERIIVVVDHDDDRATTLTSQLDRHGYYVLRRSSGIDAVECVLEYHPDLVLTESHLLDLEAPELVQSIHQAWPSTRILFFDRRGGTLRLSERQEDPAARQDELPDAPEGIAGVIDHFWEG